ncbi:FusB/FusC family EF-G-binding protein [Fredinandcohnia quinoae]|uniref:FusB/FusC family EF-G-binding protein n=1 Tax=Fredinandcohnia quinoae TaxID=2918902 RepID=A0AAW5E0F2_9BACI|nr:FusB/FusC family EF-G-binding protein [Fredinandcohnia sp. SECRCQ15]MCH1626386.1 FusB/FusC family EF-G-binding protein [Fredinandcohnia sp. SECRCQ15]
MEPFIRNEQFNFIRTQAQALVSGHTSVNDRVVLNAMKSLAIEKVIGLFIDISEEQRKVLQPIVEIEDKEQADEFLEKVKPFVIPFKTISEHAIKKLFPKVKKLKTPSLENIDLKEITYLGWDDKGSQKKYLITICENKLIGLQGTFKPLNKKGNCVICNKFEEIGMFMTETKGLTQGTFIKRGNYICKDSQKCNHNISSLEKLTDFISLLTFKV